MSRKVVCLDNVLVFELSPGHRELIIKAVKGMVGVVKEWKDNKALVAFDWEEGDGIIIQKLCDDPVGYALLRLAKRNYRLHKEPVWVERSGLYQFNDSLELTESVV